MVQDLFRSLPASGAFRLLSRSVGRNRNYDYKCNHDYTQLCCPACATCLKPIETIKRFPGLRSICCKIEVMEACRTLREQYDACFNYWFSEKFLKGDKNDSMCAELLKVYKECVEKSMKENNIELRDTDMNYLGTENEFKKPESSK